MMVGTSEVCVIDQWFGSFTSIQSSAGPCTVGLGLSRSRYFCATAGSAIVARRLKYDAVVSLSRSGGFHCPTLLTA